MEESDESAFWLEFVRDAGLANGPEQEALSSEARELLAIFIASWKTASGNN